MEAAGVEGYRPADWSPEETRQLDELVNQLGGYSDESISLARSLASHLEGCEYQNHTPQLLYLVPRMHACSILKYFSSLPLPVTMSSDIRGIADDLSVFFALQQPAIF